MSGLFSGPPKVPTPPPAPTIDDAEVAGQNKADQLRKRRGMAATILAGSTASTNAQPATQAASLLGS